MSHNYHIIPIRTTIPGMVPTMEHLPKENEVAINIADDVVYRNVNGTIVKYVPVKE